MCNYSLLLHFSREKEDASFFCRVLDDNVELFHLLSIAERHKKKNGQFSNFVVHDLQRLPIPEPLMVEGMIKE